MNSKCAQSVCWNIVKLPVKSLAKTGICTWHRSHQNLPWPFEKN